MAGTLPYTLYGASHSLYTGKARCYLRNQGIDYVEVPTSHPDFAARILPQIGRGIIPVLETHTFATRGRGNHRVLRQSGDA